MMECTVNNATVATCPVDFAPEINSDVSGIGVRISFYLQSLLLAFMAIRGKTVNEISSAMYTLVITNLAMVVTAFIMGFKKNPSLTFHDSIVAFYLLTLSWISTHLTLPAYTRFVSKDNTLQLLSIVQSYVIFAYAIAILATADTFGPSHCCNNTAKLVLFRSFSALESGRKVGWAVVICVVVLYTASCFYDYWPCVKQWSERWRCGREDGGTGGDLELGRRPLRRGGGEGLTSGFDIGISGWRVCALFITLCVWAVMVLNTELLIKWNNFQGSTNWQFGQILPMFLVSLPFANTVKIFVVAGLKRRQVSGNKERKRQQEEVTRLRNAAFALGSFKMNASSKTFYEAGCSQSGCSCATSSDGHL